MKQTTFPSVVANPQPGPANNKVDAKEIYGNGSLGGASGFTFGGNGGINGAQGIWLGSNRFETAPFSVDLKGNIKATSLTLTGFVVTGGSAADINSHGTTINGGKITAHSIAAAQITAGTITTTEIAAGTITASNISSGTITSSQIAAGTITATQINASAGITAGQLSVGTLSAITANLGTITAGTINGTTITGATIRTASSGQRVVLDTSNQISLFDSTGAFNSQIYSDSIYGLYEVSSKDIFFLNSVSSSIGIVGNTIFLSATTASVLGNFTATGTKAFDIPHPDGTDNKRLKYIATESPEVLVICRGIGDTPVLPTHFTQITEENSIQYIIGDDGDGGKNWVATGVRKGYANFQPEYITEEPLVA